MVIYVIENKINGKMYVGQTRKTSIERWKEHCKPSETNCRLLNRAIKKYGKENFSVYDIDSAESIDELNQKEVLWIKNLNTLSPFGYNLTTGGECRKCMSEESRRKISETKRNKPLTQSQIDVLKRISNKRGKDHPMYGRHHSDETKKKISEANKGKFLGCNNPNYGKHHNDEVRKKISEKNKKYLKTHKSARALPVMCIETGEIYESAKEASQRTGIDNSLIGKACKYDGMSAGKLHWKYTEVED